MCVVVWFLRVCFWVSDVRVLSSAGVVFCYVVMFGLCVLLVFGLG